MSKKRNELIFQKKKIPEGLNKGIAVINKRLKISRNKIAFQEIKYKRTHWAMDNFNIGQFRIVISIRRNVQRCRVSR